MSELETLRRALRADAERRYGRPRRMRRVFGGLIATGATALAVTAGALVAGDLRRGTRDEVVATPTVTWKAAAPTTPGAISPATQADANPGGAPARVELLAEPGATLSALLNPKHRILQAWWVPEMDGHVLVSDLEGTRCISIPDRVSPQPDIERGLTCGRTDRFGLSIRVGNDYAALPNPHAARPPMLKLPDGTRRTIEPGAGGLIAFVALPTGSSVSLYDAEGNRRTHGFQALPDPSSTRDPNSKP